MNTLNYHEQQTLLERFPQFELSYEKISHKKVFENYTLAMAIPRGKKYFAWFSFYMNKNACFMMELNKDKKIINVKIVNVKFNEQLSLGTILYGTIVTDEITSNEWVFVIEDIYYYEGNSVISSTFNQKLEFIKKIMKKNPKQLHLENIPENDMSMVCMLPVIWTTCGGSEAADTIPSSQASRIIYPVHHIKYVDPYRISPFCNVVVKKFGGNNEPSNDDSDKKDNFKKSHLPIPALSQPLHFNYYDKIYKSNVILKVIADVQFDIYHLYARGDTLHKWIYIGVAGVPTYKSSVYLNGLFRKIRENTNIDYIEESDDEEEFQKVSFNKNADLDKELLMECSFHFKSKKWVPVQVMPSNSSEIEYGKLCPMNKDTIPPKKHGYDKNYKTVPGYNKVYANKIYNTSNKI